MTATPSAGEGTLPSLWVTAYTKYLRFWITLARSAHVPEDEAQDIVHAVIGTILEMEGREFDSLEHIRNYVARAVINRSMKAKKQGDRRVSWGEAMEVRFPSVSFLEALTEAEERSAFREVLRGLSDQDFQIIKLRFYAGLTFQEIGEMLGLAISTLKSRETSALKRIRRALRKKGIQRVV